MSWDYEYKELLVKARGELPAFSTNSKRFKIPPLNISVQGNHTIINNFKKVAKYLRRAESHLLKFLLGELATQARRMNGKVDFTGKFRKREIKNKLESYVDEFVKCSECGKPDTKLVKADRVTMMQCMACGSKKPVRNLKWLMLALVRKVTIY